ncbi:hypothetical protein [Amycolatopsis benzoatilytica]|uniref:hypothetical protein n=1 Tax=Amycolatopsis benzoatilytica TaxID=346045 RepID=UPI00035D8BD4|nr:hypothetical protein [Amycolatopsis benzoatilytica]
MTVNGTALSTDQVQLGVVRAPSKAGETGELSFTVSTLDGRPVTQYEEAHDQRLHLMVVRNDGEYFRHRHPVLDPETGVWTIPWTWEAAGTYRVFTDVTPAGGESVTLSRTVEVAGDYQPRDPEPVAKHAADGYEVTLEGELAAGAGTILTARVGRGGEPVTDLERYLGSFGHLVALRQGDLAYLHIHALDDGISGPEIRFHAEAPTTGRYLLYLDYQAEGVVRTARFVLDAALAAPGAREHHEHHVTHADHHH